MLSLKRVICLKCYFPFIQNSSGHPNFAVLGDLAGTNPLKLVQIWGAVYIRCNK